LKAAGLLSGMEMFSIMVGLKMGTFGLKPQSLQGKDTTIIEAIGAANLEKEFYKRQRTDQVLYI